MAPILDIGIRLLVFDHLSLLVTDQLLCGAQIPLVHSNLKLAPVKAGLSIMKRVQALHQDDLLIVNGLNRLNDNWLLWLHLHAGHDQSDLPRNRTRHMLASAGGLSAIPGTQGPSATGADAVASAPGGPRNRWWPWMLSISGQVYEVGWVGKGQPRVSRLAPWRRSAVLHGALVTMPEEHELRSRRALLENDVLLVSSDHVSNDGPGDDGHTGTIYAPSVVVVLRGGVLGVRRVGRFGVFSLLPKPGKVTASTPPAN
ncbi:hypothetical protein FN846DRAFT_887144 [Sphaerosporella brunnea]|uniref:Uncharacterized protein n=1 Tax=Sphaerosporella brunnea TaxID=1250544 RepID=A0A5J5F7B7_9PEZI|nr:hypothetical protein FN846DRAFT_887144 [Sphaerosporella brunnea]